ncbi:MAG: cytochrome-c peroxidase [Salibacteraceae bacterium]
MKKRINLPVLVLSLLVLSSCQKDDGLTQEDTLGATANGSDPTDPIPQEIWPYSSYNYEFPDLPAHFQTAQVRGFDNTPANNPITNEGATLGRVLFYEKAMSQNQTISCASCHQQEVAFGDPAPLSDGFTGGQTGRHSMGLVNSTYYERGRFFWDERAATLEEQVLLPIQDPVEMGMDLETLVERLEGLDYYPPLFEAAFGSSEINSEKVSLALAQFIRSMVSSKSRYDEGLAMVGRIQANFPNFNAMENLGKNLFVQHCGTCHQSALGPGDVRSDAIFHMAVPLNNGLDAVTTDRGFGAVTGNPADDGKFKSGSMRNIAVQPPYMHDGRFPTLRAVIDFYSEGVQNHPNLSPPLGGGGPNGGVRQINLTNQEKEALEAFLNTMTDNEFLSDPKFSDPFKQ